MIKAVKQIIVIAVFGLIIAGVVSVRGLFNKTRARLVGKWNVTFEMTQDDLRKMGVTTNPIFTATASALMKSIDAEMQVDFRSDDTVRLDMSSFGLSTGESGTWKIGDTNDDGIAVITQFEGDSDETQWRIKFVDDNTFEMIPSEDSRFPVSQLVVFRRITEVAEAPSW